MIDSILFKFIVEGLFTGIAFLILYIVIPAGFIKLKFISLILGCLLSGTFLFYSGKKVELDRQEVNRLRLEAEIAELQIQSKNRTEKIITEYVDRIKVIEKERIVYATKTNEILNDKIINDYPVPNGFIRLHNSAAEGTIPEGPRNSDEEPSTFKINQVAETVIDNYIGCRENTEQLQALQSWVKEQELLFNGK